MSNVPQIILHHSHGTDNWEVELDCGGKIKLTTAELTRYKQFRMMALLQAGRLFPPMEDQEWIPILAEAIRSAKITADLLSCALRASVSK